MLSSSSILLIRDVAPPFAEYVESGCLLFSNRGGQASERREFVLGVLVHVLQ